MCCYVAFSVGIAEKEILSVKCFMLSFLRILLIEIFKNAVLMVFTNKYDLIYQTAHLCQQAYPKLETTILNKKEVLIYWHRAKKWILKL